MPKEINGHSQSAKASYNSDFSVSGSTHKRKNYGFTNIFSIILMVVIVSVAWVWVSNNRLNGFDKDYQAIFLTNGQVYFGQIQSQKPVEIIVKDVYYLQVTQPLQQTTEGEQQATSQKGELSLVKLGSELHGPTDSMFINRDHVLFIEDLKDDSKVVQAINNYKASQSN